MGKITVFTLPTCPFCRRAKDLLEKKGAIFTEIDVAAETDWRQFMYLLTRGRSSVPEIFFNDQLIGGLDELLKLDEEENRLDSLIKEVLSSPECNFPPPLRKPSGAEFLEILPKGLQETWQHRVEMLDNKLGGTPEHPISSILLMLETPQQMVVVCTAGPGKEIYTMGAAGDKGHEGSEEKLYCQVAIEKKETLFISDPTSVPGLEKNEDYVKFGYGYYVGAPWAVGQLRGTIVAMEKVPNVLTKEHIHIIESERDKIEEDLKSFS